MEALHSRRTYDYRIQEAICETGDRDLFPELNIPRSTIRSWIRLGPPDVIAGDLAAHDYAQMAAEIGRLRCRTALLEAVVGLLIALIQGIEGPARLRAASTVLVDFPQNRGRLGG
jgi:hypothetical protein